MDSIIFSGRSADFTLTHHPKIRLFADNRIEKGTPSIWHSEASLERELAADNTTWLQLKTMEQFCGLVP